MYSICPILKFVACVRLFKIRIDLNQDCFWLINFINLTELDTLIVGNDDILSIVPTVPSIYVNIHLRPYFRKCYIYIARFILILICLQNVIASIILLSLLGIKHCWFGKCCFLLKWIEFKWAALWDTTFWRCNQRTVTVKGITCNWTQRAAWALGGRQAVGACVFRVAAKYGIGLWVG